MKSNSKRNKMLIGLGGLSLVAAAGVATFAGFLLADSVKKGGNIDIPFQPGPGEPTVLPGTPMQNGGEFQKLNFGNISGQVNAQTSYADLELGHLLSYIDVKLDVWVSRKSGEIVFNTVLTPRNFLEKLVINNLSENTEYKVVVKNRDFEILNLDFKTKKQISVNFTTPSESFLQGRMQISNLDSYVNQNNDEKLFVLFENVTTKKPEDNVALPLDNLTTNTWTKTIEELVPGNSYTFKVFSTLNGNLVELFTRTTPFLTLVPKTPTAILNKTPTKVKINLYGLSEYNTPTPSDASAAKPLKLRYRMKNASKSANWLTVDVTVANGQGSVEIPYPEGYLHGQEFELQLGKMQIPTPPASTPPASTPPASTPPASNPPASGGESSTPTRVQETTTPPAVETPPVTPPATSTPAEPEFVPIELLGSKSFATPVPIGLNVTPSAGSRARVVLSNLKSYLGSNLKIKYRSLHSVLVQKEVLVNSISLAVELEGLLDNKEYTVWVENSDGQLLAQSQFHTLPELTETTSNLDVKETSLSVKFIGGLPYNNQKLGLSYRKVGTTEYTTQVITIMGDEFTFNLDKLDSNSEYEWTLLSLNGEQLLKGSRRTKVAPMSEVSVFGSSAVFSISKTLLNQQFGNDEKNENPSNLISDFIYFTYYPTDRSSKAVTKSINISDYDQNSTAMSYDLLVEDLEADKSYTLEIYKLNGTTKKELGTHSFTTTQKVAMTYSSPAPRKVEVNLSNLETLVGKTVKLKYYKKGETSADKMLTKAFEVTSNKMTVVLNEVDLLKVEGESLEVELIGETPTKTDANNANYKLFTEEMSFSLAKLEEVTLMAATKTVAFAKPILYVGATVDATTKRFPILSGATVYINIPNMTTNKELTVEYYKNEEKFNPKYVKKTFTAPTLADGVTTPPLFVGEFNVENLESNAEYTWRILEGSTEVQGWQTFNALDAEDVHPTYTIQEGSADASTKKINVKFTFSGLTWLKDGTQLRLAYKPQGTSGSAESDWIKLASASSPFTPIYGTVNNGVVEFTITMGNFNLTDGISANDFVLLKQEATMALAGHYWKFTDKKPIRVKQPKLDSAGTVLETNSMKLKFTDMDNYPKNHNNGFEIFYTKRNSYSSHFVDFSMWTKFTGNIPNLGNDFNSSNTITAKTLSVTLTNLESNTEYLVALVDANTKEYLSLSMLKTKGPIVHSVTPTIYGLNLAIENLASNWSPSSSSDKSYELQISKSSDFSSLISPKTKLGLNGSSNLEQFIQDFSFDNLLDSNTTYYYRIVEFATPESGEADASAKTQFLDIKGSFVTLPELLLKTTNLNGSQVKISLANLFGTHLLDGKTLKFQYRKKTTPPDTGDSSWSEISIALSDDQDTLDFVLSNLENSEYDYKISYNSVTPSDTVEIKTGSFTTTKYVITTENISDTKTKVVVTNVEDNEKNDLLLNYGLNNDLNLYANNGTYDSTNKKLTFELTNLTSGQIYVYNLLKQNSQVQLRDSFETLKMPKVVDISQSSTTHRINLSDLESFESQTIVVKYRLESEQAWIEKEFVVKKGIYETSWELVGLKASSRYQYQVELKKSSGEEQLVLKALSTFQTPAATAKETRQVSTSLSVKVNVPKDTTDEGVSLASLADIYASEVDWHEKIQEALTHLYISGDKSGLVNGNTEVKSPSPAGEWMAVYKAGFSWDSTNKKLTYKHIWAEAEGFKGLELEFQLLGLDKIFVVVKNAKKKTEALPTTPTEMATKLLNWSNLDTEMPYGSNIDKSVSSEAKYSKNAFLGGFKFYATREAISAQDQSKILTKIAMSKVIKSETILTNDLKTGPKLPGFANEYPQTDTYPVGTTQTVFGNLLSSFNSSLLSYGVDSFEKLDQLFLSNDKLALKVSTNSKNSTGKWLSYNQFKVIKTNHHGDKPVTSYDFIWKNGENFEAARLYFFNYQGMLVVQQNDSYTKKIAKGETLENLKWNDFVKAAQKLKVSSNKANNLISILEISFGTTSLMSDPGMISSPFATNQYKDSTAPLMVLFKDPETKAKDKKMVEILGLKPGEYKLLVYKNSQMNETEPFSFNLSSSAETTVLSHSLTGLPELEESNTKYYYQIKDSNGRVIKTGEFQQGVPDPVVSPPAGGADSAEPPASGAPEAPASPAAPTEGTPSAPAEGSVSS